jgi:hypothetical protein
MDWHLEPTNSIFPGPLQHLVVSRFIPKIIEQDIGSGSNGQIARQPQQPDRNIDGGAKFQDLVLTIIFPGNLLNALGPRENFYVQTLYENDCPDHHTGYPAKATLRLFPPDLCKNH